MAYCDKYEKLDKETHANFSLEDYITIKKGDWPKFQTKASLKSIGQKVKDECEEQVEQCAYSHEEDVRIKEEHRSTYETSSELVDEVDDTSVLDGYTFDESTK
jgi:hypothetical protein